mmetsp:Transcript_7334/g.18197  ORF Transcript_7334/g.18197 Transcript_7334/m.18197 type:complete len:391 (+) Transcript_7334:184-1356(+)|eukprot:CAMPEP_0181110616 /NCGR_PEP_ID=MMETSP1071-20121207/18813_1 /TAXON_ID=35127 /ORGANISM="Thalassiosira sp., Strain NH16" /LENGTH=390 /DNA_ID=CAMNT_0023194407 /DNA_START=174 /DNA_END=1346 /DNA_ORIENTATION=-
MSAGYAERLSEYPDKGVCGLPENYDTPRALTSKIDQLSNLIRRSNYTVVLTGAGISTGAGIPDFRGPNGIWTREQREREEERRKRKKKNKRKRVELDKSASKSENGKRDNESEKDGTHINNIADEPPKKKFISFETAVPTYTHNALTHLILRPPPKTTPPRSDDSDQSDDGSDKDHSNINPQRTYLHHIVTQNVDGLHRKTSLPRSKMSVLHGCIFTEVCDTCDTEHVREKEIQSIGLKHTGRKCTLGGDPMGSCPGMLKDTLLDWEDGLPEVDWYRAQEECSRADLVLCLGTSLRIEPAASLCTYPITADEHDPYSYEGDDGKERKKRKLAGKETKIGYVIVNLQNTPYDDGAALVVRGKVDEVMEGLMLKLGYGDDWEVINEPIVIDD